MKDIHQEHPYGWRWVKLGDVVRIVNGSTPDTGNPEYWNGDIAWITPADLGKLLVPIITTTARRITKIGQIRAGIEIIPVNSIIMSSRAPIGHLAISAIPLGTNQGCKSMIPSPKIDPYFLFWSLKHSMQDIQSLGSGATFTEISKTNLESYKIIIPTQLEEQRRIASILQEQMAAVEQARAAAQARLAAIEVLPAAYLRQVFPRSDQPLPAGWRWVRLREIIREARSGFACGERDINGIIQLRMNNVDTRGNFVWNDILRVPKEGNNIDLYLLTKGDVLFNNTNSTELVGKSALFDCYEEPIVYSNHFTRLRSDCEKLLPSFLASWLNHQWQDGVFTAICNRWIGQSAVKPDKLLSLDFPLPPLDEQRRIEQTLIEKISAAEQARAAAEAELEAIDALPGALLRRAFAGEL